MRNILAFVFFLFLSVTLSAQQADLSKKNAIGNQQPALKSTPSNIQSASMKKDATSPVIKAPVIEKTDTASVSSAKKF